MNRRSVGLICIMLTWVSYPQPTESRTYHRQDHQYYKNMIADIRNTRNHISWYRANPVQYTSSNTADDNHRFWDVAFGDTYALFGFNYDSTADSLLFKKRGIDFFLEPQVHMLLDFSANSNAVINADFRGGAGFRGRGFPIPKKVDAVKSILAPPRKENWTWVLDQISWRFRGFHECTHLGDEFILDAAHADSLFRGEVVEYKPDYIRRDSALNPFQRYNVSYEAFDLFLAWDTGNPWKLHKSSGVACSDRLDGCGNPTDEYLENLDGSNHYLRTYKGVRWLNDGEYNSYLKYHSGVLSQHPRINDPLRSKDWEFQYGFEYFNELNRGSSANTPYHPNFYIKGVSAVLNSIPVLSILIPDLDEARYGLVAADHYWRSQYVIDDPGYTLAGNYVIGLIWGEYFRANSGQRSFSLLANWYGHEGPNPHGQFRSEELHYEKFNGFLPEIRFDINIGH